MEGKEKIIYSVMLYLKSLWYTSLEISNSNLHIHLLKLKVNFDEENYENLSIYNSYSQHWPHIKIIQRV